MIGVDHLAQVLSRQEAGDQRELGRQHHDPGERRVGDGERFDRVERDERRDLFAAGVGGDEHAIQAGVGDRFDQVAGRGAVCLGLVGARGNQRLQLFGSLDHRVISGVRLHAGKVAVRPLLD